MKYSFKICALACLILVCSLQAGAQKHGIGLHFGGSDFYGPQTGQYFKDNVYTVNYNTELSKYDTVSAKKFRWNPVVRFSYWWQINKLLDFNVGVGVGNLDYPASDKDSAYILRKQFGKSSKAARFHGELDARLNLNILSRDKYIISPYIFAGLSLSHHWIYFGAAAPVGLGFNIKVGKSTFVNLESAYKVPLTDKNQAFLQHTVGLVHWFTPKYKTPEVQMPAVVEAKPDTDGDGVLDENDACPTIKGVPQFAGCPDSDNDGVSDKDDECPLVAGLPAMRGCPDSDGDGINDKNDKCPYVAGTADRQGCPIPDKDGDGFNDDVDRCPELYSKTNSGCPEIRQEIINKVSKAAKAIFFETGKSTIKKTSFKSLDAIVSVLKEDPSLYADIEGHTDNVGNEEYNMQLSKDRANAVKDYFIGKGIADSRLSSEGFGETQPVASNETATGKAANRRTVISLRNYAK